MAIGLSTLVAIITSALAFVLDRQERRRDGHDRRPGAGGAAGGGSDAAAPTLADAKGVAFEKFDRVDPTLPPVPAGRVKKFNVDVYQHVTQVSEALAPTEVWSFAVNGERYTRHRRVGADGGQRGRHGRLHAHQRLRRER